MTINVEQHEHDAVRRPPAGRDHDERRRGVRVARAAHRCDARHLRASSTSTTTLTSGADIRVENDGTDTRDSDFPVLVVAGTAAYLAWQDTSTLANGGSDISFSHSTNGGTSWSTQQTIDDPAGEVSASFTPTMSVDPKTAGSQVDDIVALAWEDRREGTQVFSSISTNGAATLRACDPRDAMRKNSQPAARSPASSVCRRSPPRAASVWVVSWQNQAATGAVEHVFVASSIDDGTSWR